MRIMLCDDSMTVRKKMAQQLRAICDCDIIEAKNGSVAIDAYKAMRPDLVLMDIMMPVKSGLEALDEIIVSDPNAKIVMLSSVGTKTNLQEALKKGAVDFVQKPCSQQRLQSLIDTYVKEV